MLNILWKTFCLLESVTGWVKPSEISQVLVCLYAHDFTWTESVLEVVELCPRVLTRNSDTDAFTILVFSPIQSALKYVCWHLKILWFLADKFTVLSFLDALEDSVSKTSSSELEQDNKDVRSQSFNRSDSMDES